MAEIGPKPRRSIKVLGWLLMIVVVLGAAEAIAAGYFLVRDGRWRSVASRLNGDGNDFIAEIQSRPECRYIDGLYPHPYLAHVHHRNPPCEQTWINNVGLFGRDFPLQREPSRFAILLTGGSVAAQLGQIDRDGPLFLEDELNHCYSPPHGERFVVYNGADGGWKQPQQTILTLLYGDAFDAIVSLEGFNEYLAVTGAVRFEIASNSFLAVNPIAASEFRPLIAAWVGSAIVRYAASNWLLSRSFLSYAAIDVIRVSLRRFATAATALRVQSQETMFALPADWPAERRAQFNLEQYRRYVESMATLMHLRGRPTAIFIQPVPAIGKRLTTEEREVVGDLAYAANYRRLSEALLSLRSSGVDVHSLLDVFAGVDQSIYADPIHFRRQTDGDSPGNRIVARAMARHLAESWGLTRRCP